jgi:hypothetical protein
MSADARIALMSSAPLGPVSPRDGERSSTEFGAGRVAHWYDAEGDGAGPGGAGARSPADSNDQLVVGGAYKSRREPCELIAELDVGRGREQCGVFQVEHLLSALILIGTR